MKKKRLTIDIAPDLHLKLKLLAVETGRSMAELIVDWIEEHLPKAKHK